MALQLQSSKMHTLTRGKLATFDINDMLKLQEYLKDGDLREIGKCHRKILDARIRGDFNSGSSVTFRANADITVTRLAFWGPLSGNETDFDVVVNISQGREPGQVPHSPKTEVQIARFTSQARASPNEKFYIDFPDGIPTRKGFYNKISFVLKGSQTRVCARTNWLEKCPESRLEFEFHNSSHQMPEIQFRFT